MTLHAPHIILTLPPSRYPHITITFTLTLPPSDYPHDVTRPSYYPHITSSYYLPLPLVPGHDLV